MNYVYKAKVIGVYDGDTVTLEVDLGFHVYSKIKARLLYIDAPEIRGVEKEKGIVVRDYLRSLILNKEVIIKTLKDKKGKYGRWLVQINLCDLDVNKHLLDEGFASPYNG